MENIVENELMTQEEMATLVIESKKFYELFGEKRVEDFIKICYKNLDKRSKIIFLSENNIEEFKDILFVLRTDNIYLEDLIKNLKKEINANYENIKFFEKMILKNKEKLFLNRFKKIIKNNLEKINELTQEIIELKSKKNEIEEIKRQ